MNINLFQLEWHEENRPADQSFQKKNHFKFQPTSEEEKNCDEDATDTRYEIVTDVSEVIQE